MPILPCHPLSCSYDYRWHGINDTGLKFLENYHKKHLSDNSIQNKNENPHVCIFRDLIGWCTRGDFLFFFQLRPGLSDKGFHVNKLSSEFLKNLLGIFFLEKTNNCFEQRIKLLVYYLNCILVKFFNLKLKTKEFRIFRFFLSLKKAEFRVFLGLKDKKKLKNLKFWNFFKYKIKIAWDKFLNFFS